MCIWRRGLNLVPIAAPPAAEPFRVSHYALQLQHARILLRNLHCPASGARDRHLMSVGLHDASTCMAFLVVGDFNGAPERPSNAVAMLPLDPTFRLNATTGAWLSRIDGALLAEPLSYGATLVACPPAVGLQRRAV